MSNNDLFVNPAPPSNYVHPKSDDQSHPLTNEDFRKLLMTPSASGINREKATTAKVELNSSKKKFANEAAERRREKKLYYASLMKEVKEREAELAQKYRDRAKERREQQTKPANSADNNQEEFVSTTSNFRAVAPNFSLADNADRRRQIIEESKYLGGDLEHTHLVKGLDYALLQKVRAELEKKMESGDEDDEDESGEHSSSRNKSLKERDEDEENAKSEGDEEDEEDFDYLSGNKKELNLKPKLQTKSEAAAIAAALSKSQGVPKLDKKKKEEIFQKDQLKSLNSSQEETEDLTKITFKTKMGRNIYRILFETKLPKMNELFLPNRMAYIVDLNDEEADVPVTSIRSKAECPNSEALITLTTNDIVINKLTQILSYLRQSKRDNKKNKKKDDKLEEAAANATDKLVEKTDDFSIYDDVGDYVPDLSKKSRSAESNEVKKRNYFFSEDKEKYEDDVSAKAPSTEVVTEFIKNINEKYSSKEVEPKKEEKKTPGMSVKFDSDSYAECYPGTNAEEDVNIDSDEEADFSKMDLGTKKGPVNRWDFESNEEYSDYMSNKEAMPKAAFQFGLKMTDGRKTRRIGTENKNDKTKLDKEWTQISKIIDKRKSGETSGFDAKKLKY